MISSVFIGSGFAICGLVMMFLIFIIFISKKKKWDMRSIIFFITAIVTILILSLEIVVSYTIVNRETYPILNNILCRIYRFFNILWFFLASRYIASVFIKFDNNKNEMYFSIIFEIIAISCSLLFAVLYNISFDVCIEGEPCFIAGSYYTIMKVIGFLSSSGHILIIFLNRKRIKNMNLTSIFFLGFVFLVGNVILYLISKDLNILSITLALTITILFFTIENQDIKLLDEYENMRKESIKSSEAKSDFLVNMSHEIRTPLTTILGFSQTLLYNDNLTEEILKKDLVSIKKANNGLTNLINSLSDISSLENNKVVLSESDYSLENLIFEIYSYIPPKINKDNLMFSIKVNPDIPKK